MQDYGVIAGELVAMMEEDQAMRERTQKDVSAWNAEIDRRNTERLKEIVERIGWPTVSKVGAEASEGAWLIVQHADHDIAFQRLALGLMEAATIGEVQLRDIAYLTDRILANEDKPQRFGTQFRRWQGVYEAAPIEDAEHLDERRKAHGLEPFAEYMAHMLEKYQPR